MCALGVFVWGKGIVDTQSKQRMPVIAIYCYSVLFATNGSKTGNVTFWYFRVNTVVVEKQ